jgi:hypothetical protein
LEQTDEVNSNTSLSAPLTQNLSNRYLYHWQGAISGTGNNRRAGLHFFADNAALPNRGNGYFVWFRVDQSQLQFYEVVNDVFTLQASYPMTINAGQWYDWKVVYDRITGKMEVYQDGVFIGSWTDATPYANGNCISLRSGNCVWEIDEFRVYRSRFTNGTVNVTVGACPNCDIRFENTSPNISAGLIRSVNRDSAMLFSAVAQQYYDVDWTPAIIVQPLDGNAADIDTTSNLTLIEGNWTLGVDTNSGAFDHWYCIGTTPGDSDFVAWTNNGFGTAFSIPTTLTQGQWYYIGLRVENGAGLWTTIDTSDGQIADIGSGLLEQASGWSLHPNPVVYELVLNSSSTARVEQVDIYDANGKLASSVRVPQNRSVNAPIRINVGSLAAGRYTLVIHDGEIPVITTFIKQ